MKINAIIIHCSDSPNGRDVTSMDIERWHRERRFLRTNRWISKFNPSFRHIGYQYVIRLDGTVEKGRAVGEAGAHAKGHNANSVGICLVGRTAFTKAQWFSLRELVCDLEEAFPEAEVLGHRNVDPYKSCPNFDVKLWVRNGYTPHSSQILLK